MKLFVVYVLLGALGPLYAQNRPQLVWQGQVDGISTLYIRGKRIEIQDREGGPVQEQRFQFYKSLPDVHQAVRLDLLEGRGYVHIVEQPDVDNDYTLAVSIEDRQEGRSVYSLALYWDTPNERYENPRALSRGGRLTWSGRINGDVTVDCHASTCESNVSTGQPVLRERSKFSRPMPASDVQVTLFSSDGPGDIRLLEQPEEKNGYTARVLIRDPLSGPSDCSFTLTWTAPERSVPEHARSQLRSSRGLLWRGRVDDAVRVTIQGGSAFSQALRGQPVVGERVEFFRPLPTRSGLSPTIRKLLGRGRVEIVEYPSNENHYRLVFEVHDSEDGADDYEVEVGW